MECKCRDAWSVAVTAKYGIHSIACLQKRPLRKKSLRDESHNEMILQLLVKCSLSIHRIIDLVGSDLLC